MRRETCQRCKKPRLTRKATPHTCKPCMRKAGLIDVERKPRVFRIATPAPAPADRSGAKRKKRPSGKRGGGGGGIVEVE